MTVTGVSENTACRAVICAANHFVSSHKCVKCAAGTKNDAGDDSSSSVDTVCDQVMCLKDQYVIASTDANSNEVLTCTNCISGYTMGTRQNVTTANAKDANDVMWTSTVTPCHATVCQENYHVDSSNRCGTLRLYYTAVVLAICCCVSPS